ncbi:MAG: YfhO family protein [Thermodesulfovibrionales bacterium]|nr:YfhO family protein [Thermodesulfovibrionales bacterium]
MLNLRTRKRFFQKNLFYFILFLFLSCLYFHRIFTEGVVVLHGDAYLQNYPLRHFFSETIKGFQFPLWIPHVFAGMPYIGMMQTGALYPPNILLYTLLPSHHAFNASLLLHLASAGFFTFLYLRAIGLGGLPSFAGGVAFSFLGFPMGHLHHTAILNAAVWLPLIMYTTEMLKRTAELRYSLLLSLVVAIQLFAGNFQICLYTYIVLFLFLMFSLMGLNGKERLKFVILSAGGFFLGLIVAFPQIMAAYELSGLSMRPIIVKTIGYPFFQAFHVYPNTLPSLIFPHLFTGVSYGRSLPAPEDGFIAFVGILPLVVAMVVFLKDFRAKNPVRFWGVVGIVSFLLSIAGNTPLGRILFSVPVYNMFRAHGRNFFEFSFAVSVLFAYGLEGISSKRYLKASLFVLASVLAVSALAVITVQTFNLKPLGEVIVFGNPVILVPLLFMLFYVLWLHAYRLRPKKVLLYISIILLLAESYYAFPLPDTSFKTANIINVCRNEGYEFLKRIEGTNPFRIARPDNPTYINLNNIICGVDSFNSYDQLVLKDYANLFELEIIGYSRDWEHLIKSNALLSMMNVKYVIIPKYLGISVIGVETMREKPLYITTLNDPALSRISSTEDRKASTLIIEHDLETGTYLIYFKARALEQDASLRMEAYGSEEAWRNSLTPLHIYPGIISGEFEGYYRVYHNDKPQRLNIRFISPKLKGVEIKDILIYRIEGYNPPPISTDGKVYKSIAETGSTVIYLNKNVLPRAYPVREVVSVKDIWEVKRKFDLNEINPSIQALVYGDEFSDISRNRFAVGDVAIEDYGIHRITVRTDFPKEGFLVLSEQYYHGWKAFIDGKETRIYRVNGILKGVIVPEGRHKVIFKYMPYGLIFSIVLSILIASGIIIALILNPPTRARS